MSEDPFTMYASLMRIRVQIIEGVSSFEAHRLFSHFLPVLEELNKLENLRRQVLSRPCLVCSHKHSVNISSFLLSFLPFFLSYCAATTSAASAFAGSLTVSAGVSAGFSSGAGAPSSFGFSSAGFSALFAAFRRLLRRRAVRFFGLNGCCSPCAGSLPSSAGCAFSAGCALGSSSSFAGARLLRRLYL